jgi:hypothetical protein
METPPCSCAGPGYCQRYAQQMTEYTWRLCVSSHKYRRLWDAVGGILCLKMKEENRADEYRKRTRHRRQVPLECTHLREWTGRLELCLVED